MFRNYLIVALRNIERHKLFSFINIIGLALGLACVLFVILFVRDELSYDTWVPNTENLYRIENTILLPGRPPLALAPTPHPMPAAMNDEIPEVTGQTRIWSEGISLTAGNRQFFEQVNVVDPKFFQIIKLPLLVGDPAQVFAQPNSIVLSQSAARKFFGDSESIGRTITTLRGGCDLTDVACNETIIALKVTGIARDLPRNSQLTGDIFFPNTSLADRIPQRRKIDWLSNGGYGYVTLAPGADPQSVIAKMAPILNRELTGDLRKLGISMTGEEAYKIHLTPFRQVHLDSSQWNQSMTPPGSWATVYGVAAIGLLILLVACFNFMNLATARASMRAREIGLRKTLGARRSHLMVQFLGEALLMALLALVLALALVEILLPSFSGFLQRPITFQYFADWQILALIFLTAIGTGIIGGSYPALVLSAFQPAAVLRGSGAARSGSGRLRTVLVVLQFSVSIGLGIAAIVVFSQINFARSIDLGFQRDNLLIVNGGRRVTMEGRESFVQTLRSHPGIVAIGLSDMVPFDNSQSNVNVKIPGRPDTVILNAVWASPDFPKVYDIRLVAGRLLSEVRAEDRMYRGTPLTADPRNEGGNILINEAAAKLMGFTPQEAVGKAIVYGQNHVNIVGVVGNIAFKSAREPINPTAYSYVVDAPATLTLRLRPDTIPQTLELIDKSWRAFSPNSPIQRRFLNDSFDKLYEADQRQGAMFGIFVAIAIFIACLGLFGLAAFTVDRRTREIGIRKVFGASTRDVVLLLLWQFSIPILIANLIAWPLVWFYLQRWLESFAYRISLGPHYFIGAGLIALLIGWATIFVHALRMARANPVHALSYE